MGRRRKMEALGLSPQDAAKHLHVARHKVDVAIIIHRDLDLPGAPQLICGGPRRRRWRFTSYDDAETWWTAVQAVRVGARVAPEALETPGTPAPSTPSIPSIPSMMLWEAEEATRRREALGGGESAATKRLLHHLALRPWLTNNLLEQLCQGASGTSIKTCRKLLGISCGGNERNRWGVVDAAAFRRACRERDLEMGPLPGEPGWPPEHTGWESRNAAVPPANVEVEVTVDGDCAWLSILYPIALHDKLVSRARDRGCDLARVVHDALNAAVGQPPLPPPLPPLPPPPPVQPATPEPPAPRTLGEALSDLKAALVQEGIERIVLHASGDAEYIRQALVRRALEG